MKIIKILALVLAAGLAGLISYANVRHLSLAEKLKRVNLASFNLKGEISTTEMLQLEKKMSAIPGITACSLNKEGNVAFIIFYPEQLNEDMLTNMLSSEGKLNVSPRELSTSGGCPIHQLGSSFHEFLTVLDIRN